MCRIVMPLSALIAFSGLAHAQGLPVTAPAFVRAALVVATFDRLHADCRKAGGPSDAQAAKVTRWQADNGVQEIRARMLQLAEHASLMRQVDQGADAVVQRMLARKVDSCTAAVSVTQLPDAQLARLTPRLLAADAAATPAGRSPATESQAPSLGGDGQQAADGKPSAPESRRPTPARRSAGVPQALLDRIDSFGFDTRAKMGVGGVVTLDIYPVVLMKSGEALTNVEGLAAPDGLEAHRRAHPKDWTRWRREGGKLQLEKKKGWEPLPFQTTYARLPQDMKLDGPYRDLKGAGTIGVGGTQSVMAYDEYRFSRDGSVERTGGAGGSAEAGDTAVSTSVRKRVRRGRYSIDGLTLGIRYDDGSSEQRILIADPKGAAKAIWLDGTGYVKR